MWIKNQKRIYLIFNFEEAFQYLYLLLIINSKHFYDYKSNYFF